MSIERMAEGGVMPAGTTPDRLCELVDLEADGPVHLLAVYDTSDTDPIVVTRNEAVHLEVDVASLLEYLQHDVLEQHLFKEGFMANADGPTYHSRGAGEYQFLSVYTDAVGVTIVLDDTEELNPLVDTVERHLATV